MPGCFSLHYWSYILERHFFSSIFQHFRYDCQKFLEACMREETKQEGELVEQKGEETDPKVRAARPNEVH